MIDGGDVPNPLGSDVPQSMTEHKTRNIHVLQQQQIIPFFHENLPTGNDDRVRDRWIHKVDKLVLQIN